VTLGEHISKLVGLITIFAEKLSYPWHRVPHQRCAIDIAMVSSA
jgi:hypothetical protein